MIPTNLPPGWRKSVPADGPWARDREWIVFIGDAVNTRVAAVDGQWMAWPGYYFRNHLKAAMLSALDRALDRCVRERSRFDKGVSARERSMLGALEDLHAFNMPPIDLPQLTAEQKREHQLMAEAEARAAERGCAS